MLRSAGRVQGHKNGHYACWCILRSISDACASAICALGCCVHFTQASPVTSPPTHTPTFLSHQATLRKSLSLKVCETSLSPLESYRNNRHDAAWTNAASRPDHFERCPTSRLYEGARNPQVFCLPNDAYHKGRYGVRITRPSKSRSMSPGGGQHSTRLKLCATPLSERNCGEDPADLGGILAELGDAGASVDRPRHHAQHCRQRPALCGARKLRPQTPPTQFRRTLPTLISVNCMLLAQTALDPCPTRGAPFTSQLYYLTAKWWKEENRQHLSWSDYIAPPIVRVCPEKSKASDHRTISSTSIRMELIFSVTPLILSHPSRFTHLDCRGPVARCAQKSPLHVAPASVRVRLPPALPPPFPHAAGRAKQKNTRNTVLLHRCRKVRDHSPTDQTIRLTR